MTRRMWMSGPQIPILVGHGDYRLEEKYLTLYRAAACAG